MKTRLRSEGAKLPSDARGYTVLRGCRLGSVGRATNIFATRRSWEFDDVRMSFLVCPPDRWSEELDDRVEDETQDHVAFGDDAEFD